MSYNTLRLLREFWAIRVPQLDNCADFPGYLNAGYQVYRELTKKLFRVGALGQLLQAAASGVRLQVHSGTPMACCQASAGVFARMSSLPDSTI